MLWASVAFRLGWEIVCFVSRPLHGSPAQEFESDVMA